MELESATLTPALETKVMKRTERWLRKAFTLKHRKRVGLWLKAILEEMESRDADAPFTPSVLKMQQLLETDGIARMYVTQMLEESYGATRDGVFGKITSIAQMLKVINYIITRAPSYNPDPELTGAYTFPLSSLFTEMMATDTGESAFRNEAFNGAMTAVLQEWCEYLDSEASTSVLNEGEFGWLSPSAQKYTGLDDFVVPDRSAPHYGFASYNAFFHRQIKLELRPIAAPEDQSVIVSPNDGTIYQIVSNVQRSTDFWAKGQTYSLINILNDSAYVDDFVGGDMVQTFLSGNDFHRFHSPIDGTVVKVEIVQGLTFSQRSSEKEPGAGTESLGYEAAVNTRGLVYIKSDLETIGTVCVIPIGITEVSSIRFGEHIKEGAKVKKGEEIGRFSYGGSTLCMLFQPNAVKNFVLLPKEGAAGELQEQATVRVNAQIATANL